MFAARNTGIAETAAKTCRFLCLLLMQCLFTPAEASNLFSIEISEHSGNYRVRMATLIHAPARDVSSVLTDYRHIYRLNPAITESEILPSPQNGAVRVKTRIKGCIFFFCRNIDRLEEVREVETGHLQAVIIPEQSDFSSGSADWRIQQVGNESKIIYEAQVTPAFFIPPIIGNYFVKRTFADAVITSFAKLECIARIRAGLDSRSQRYIADAAPGTTDIDAMQQAMLVSEDPPARNRHTGTGYNTRNTGCPGSCDQPRGNC